MSTKSQAVTQDQPSLFEGSSPSSELRCGPPQPKKQIHPPDIRNDASALQSPDPSSDGNRILATTDPTPTASSSGVLLGKEISHFFSLLGNPQRETVVRRIGVGPYAVIMSVKQEQIELRALLGAADSFGEAEADYSIAAGKDEPARKRTVTSASTPLSTLTEYLEKLQTYSHPHKNPGFIFIPDTVANTDNSIVSEKTNSPVPSLEVRKDDRVFSGSRVVLEFHRNDDRIYDALMQMAFAHGSQNDDGTLMIAVGYKAISVASGCSPTAIRRAWPRLLKWGFVMSIEPHRERRPAQYVVRTLAAVDARFKEAGCSHVRILRSGAIQPFRAAANTEEKKP